MMKLSEEAKKYAQGLMNKDHLDTALWAEKDQYRIRASRTQSNPQFGLMINHYEESVRRTFRSMINAYVEAYKMDDALIDEEDKDEIIGIIKSMIDSRFHHITNSVSNRDFLNPVTGEKIPNLDLEIRGHFDRLLGEAATEFDLARNTMVMEKRKKDAEAKLNAGNQINIYGPNLGPIQQAGQNNTQSVSINAEFEAKIRELFALVENSSLSPVQKLKAVNDIRTVHEFSRIETTPEVQEEVKTKLESLTSVISLSADLVTLGMPIILIIRNFFGI
jgi:hypothetical protein